MVSVDKFFDNHYKRQKYLGLRVVVLLLLVVLNVGELSDTEEVSNTIFFNTIFLLFLPLLIEYLFGMDTYSFFTNVFRWMGLIISAVMVSVCILGFMGEANIVLNDEGYVYEVILLSKLSILFWIKLGAYFISANAFFDYIFTFNKREKKYYNMIDDTEIFLEDNFKELKKNVSFESRKSQIREKLPKLGEGNLEGGKDR
ncbi:hypothetical protein [Planococcus halocryophilus]|uniref:hypothetical protein n=1 Tax=Planococcus halocryophilus TaxID=1215089 RepID=UPI001F10904D|nr:hypothetical protein [Planococcus halocryophilus]MCH4825549.1 hypothetical protein [Planococcus halocryophilus]